ncbi:hypothetical protein [Sorangium cellulosum]|uniref:hypothetical protein n=1 Tax=Sorangium cellulosum TaxID=56 RepID=UPI0012FFA322|nr:hypothetical protein [Sorangium cellulosum]
MSSSDHPGVIRVVNDLKADIGRVTQIEPQVSLDEIPAAGSIPNLGRAEALNLGRVAGILATPRHFATSVHGASGPTRVASAEPQAWHTACDPCDREQRPTRSRPLNPP